MQKKITILFSMMLLAISIVPASAQWFIPGADLETQTSYSTGYTNVIIDNHMEVGEGTTGTTSCPTTTYGTGTTDYPFVVNDISGGNTIVLWDNGTSDPIRKIIGLSQWGGVAVYAGNDNFSGAGIVLNGSGNPATMPTGTYTTGMVQTVSNVSTASGTGGIAFEHSNWHGTPGTTGTLDQLFSIDEAGNTNIAGNYLSFRNTDVAMRNIEAKSTSYGLNICTGDAISVSSAGTGMQMFSPANTASPGLMQFGAFGSTSSTSLAYSFYTGSVAAPTSGFQMLNTGNSRIGSYSLPTTTDRLTVDGNLYLNSTDNNDATARNILARSQLGLIHLTSGSNTDGSDGACQTAIAWNNTSYITPGIGTITPGAFLVRSCAPLDASPNFRYLAYGFQAYEQATSSLSNIFLINTYGEGIFGFGISLSDIQNFDVFTIQKSLGFWSAGDADTRTIDANSSTRALSISAMTNYDNGSNIARTEEAIPQIQEPSGLHHILRQERHPQRCLLWFSRIMPTDKQIIS